jgi:hypothetical protein
MTTKSWIWNFPAVIYERSTSTRSMALRSDCSNRAPWIVFVVAKNVRADPTIPSGRELRAGLDIHRGLKPSLSITLYGTT